MQVMEGVSCLDEELIAAFVVGSLSASERVRVELHLADCDACLRVVSAAAYGCVGESATVVSPADERPASSVGPLGARLGARTSGDERALAELHHELLDGALPGRFRLLDLLGRGGVGTVWRAYDGVLGGAVALKVLHAIAGPERARVKDQFRALASLSHPHLVTFHQLVLNEQASFISMELVSGLDFSSHHRGRRGPAGQIDYAGLCESARQLALALDHLHGAGQLHRDVKPSNVRVTEQGRVVLLELGLAWPRDKPELARGVEVAGRLRYMAPEQRAGRTLTPAADWYAFGLTLHHAIAGSLPAPEPLAGALGQHVPGELRALISRLLAPAPWARPSAKEVLQCLGRCAGVPR